jgi:site-specific recombinase XerD
VQAGTFLDHSQQGGLETLRIHDLRHVFATTALEAGVPLITIAPLLGQAAQ